MISFEQSSTSAGTELNISLGTFIETEVLEKAFAIRKLPVGWGYGTIQPQPDRSDVWMMWFGFVLVLILLDFGFTTGVVAQPVDQFYFYLSLAIVSAWPVGLLILRYNIEVQRWKDSDFSPYASGDSDD